MEYVVVAFRSRAHTVKFYEILSNNGISAQIVNTPKEAGVGCGLSVKISKERLGLVKGVAYRVNLSSLAGFFIVSMIGGKRIVRPV